MLESVLYPLAASTATGIITWLLAYGKNKRDLKSMEIENEMKAAQFYKSLLDDAKLQIDHLIEATKERDEKIKERDKKIELLIEQVEILTNEIRKYKQLNGKSE